MTLNFCPALAAINVLMTNWLVPVARPTTVSGSPVPSNASCSWPASLTLTWAAMRYVPVAGSVNSVAENRVGGPAPTVGPSCGNSTAAPTATVAVLSPGIRAKNNACGVEPAGPVAPVAPVAPAAPAGPADPVAPVGPGCPSGPTGPIGPCGPEFPVSPGAPCPRPATVGYVSPLLRPML